MIELTVKTLDSNNHIFEVEAESTVAQLKEKIREALGLELDRQRLIFCGRVLQDDQILHESGVENGKCVHLVQRAPPSPQSRRRDRDRMEGGNAGDNGGSGPRPLRSLRNLMDSNDQNDLLMEQQMASISPTAGRLNFIHGIIREIRSSLAALRDRAGHLIPSGVSRNDGTVNMDTDSSGEAQSQAENSDERDDSDDEEELSAHVPRFRRLRAIRSMGPRFYANPRDLGKMLEELERLHDDFAPFRMHYVAMLRTLIIPDYQEPERQQWQDVVRLISDIMHSFAHCYHSISDITYNVGQRYPRLTSELPAPTRHTIPVQAHINVVTATGPHSMSGDRRGAGAGSAGAATTSATTATGATGNTATGATATTGATHTASASQASTPRPAAPPPSAPNVDLQTTSETFNVRRTSSTDRTPIHTTTRTFTRPATEGTTPSSYQVEIETRGHIAIPLDNNLLSGLAAVASNLRQAQGQHDQAIADAQAARAAATAVRLESDPIEIPVSNLQRSNLPPGLVALENLEIWSPVGPDTSTAPAAWSAPSAAAAPSAPAQCPVRDPVRETVLRRVQQAERQSANTNVEPATQASTPVTPSAQTASGSTFLGSIPINIGPRSSPIQGATSAAADSSQRGNSASTNGASRPIRRNARMSTGGVSRTPQAHGHSHVHVAGQPADGSRPRFVMDLENLMRNLSGGVGMEVVMSMEEMPNFLSGAGLDAGVNDQAGGVYVTPLFAAHNVGGTPTADLLQNIVAIVRNRMMPQDPPQNQGQSQNRGQGQAQNQGQSQNQGSDQSNADRRNQWQAPWGGPRRRATFTNYPYAMACLVYDRYLNCDSAHARHHLRARRDLYQRQAEEQQRPRAARRAAPEIEVIRVRNRRFTANHMSTMRRLLNEPITEQGQMNAFMLVIARHVFLNPILVAPIDPTPVPTEFSRIRIQLRDYVQRMLERSVDSGSFETFSEQLITQTASFLRGIPSIQSSREASVAEIDPTASLRAMIRARLPTVITCIMSEASNEMFAARFYSVLYRFFADLCTLFMCFIEDGFDGLVRRFDEFMATITENYGSYTRDWLRVVAHQNLIASRPYILSAQSFNAREYFRQADGSIPPPSCCLYQARREDIVVRNLSLLPQYCERHLQLLRPLQAPPLLPPPADEDSSRGSTPTTATSEDGQGEHVDMEDEAEAWLSEFDSQATAPDAGSNLRSEGSSTIGSPSHSRSEPQAEAEEASAAESMVSESSPRLLRRWGRQSPNDSQSLASDLTSESHPPGLIAIDLTDNDSLCDVEELDVGALVDDIDPYVCDYTEIRRPVVHSPLNIIEDDADDAVNEDDDDDEVDVETIEDDSSLMAEDLKIRKRREKRERSIRRDVARRRLEGNVRHKKFITMQEAERRLDLRAMQQTAREMDYDSRLHMALDRVVEERIRLEETGEQTHGTDEEHEEISEEEEPSKQVTISEEEDSSTLGSDEDPEDPELERMQQELERMDAELEILNEHPLLRLSLMESLASLNRMEETEAANQLAAIMRRAGFLDDEPAEELLDPEPSPAGVCTHEMPDEFELLYLDPIIMMPLQMSQLNINEPEFLTPISVPRSNDAVRNGNDFQSDDESSNEYLSPIHRAAPAEHHRPAQGVDDDWYSLPHYRYPYAELENDGYFSPQLNMYHERPGFLTPQPIRVNSAASPSTATTKSVSDQSEECNDEGYDDFNRMVPQQVVPKTSQPTKKDDTQQATDIAKNGAQTSNAETGRKDIPHTSDDLDLATQLSAPLESIMENEEWHSIMGSTWEPVLREDGAAQASGVRPQPPFSDAYLSGMPARKRRCLRDSRPEATFDALMNDSIRAVSEAVPGGLRGSEAELTQLLRDSVRGLVAARTRDQPEDYEPTRFPSTAAFLANADRTKTKEPEEKNPTPP